jgi:hypothetical protein
LGKEEEREEKGEGRREKGEGRREKGEGRREKGERRREKGERSRGGEEGGRKDILLARRTFGDEPLPARPKIGGEHRGRGFKGRAQVGRGEGVAMFSFFSGEGLT